MGLPLKQLTKKIYQGKYQSLESLFLKEIKLSRFSMKRRDYLTSEQYSEFLAASKVGCPLSIDDIVSYT